MHTIEYLNTPIAYSSQGSGQPIVFIHGYGTDSQIWTDFAADLKETHQVILIDMPGFGQSGVMKELSIDKIAEAVHEVLTHLKVEKPIIIGHSMGGYVTLAYLEKYPNVAKGIGLFHSHPYSDTPEVQTARTKAIGFLQRQGSTLYIKQFVPNLFNPVFVKSNRFLIEKLTYQALNYPVEGIQAALEAMRERPDRQEVLKNSTCPVLFIIGKEDALIPKAYSKEQTYLPAVAAIHIMDKVGHMGMYEDKKRTLRYIKEFIVFCD